MAVPAKPTLNMETILVGIACHYILCMGGCVCVRMCMCVRVRGRRDRYTYVYKYM